MSEGTLPPAPGGSTWLSLRTRIVLLVMLAVLVPAAAMVAHHVHQRTQDIRQAERNLAAAVHIAENQLESRINGTTQLLFGLSQSRELETANRDACSAYLEQVKDRYPQYTGILTIKPNGELHCDSLRTGRRLDLNDRAYFRQAMTSADPAYELTFGRLTGIGVLQVALAARDARGQVKYVLLASIDLQKFAEEVATAQPYARSVMPIFDRTGTLIAGYAGANVKSQAGQNFADSDLFRFAQAGRPGDTTELVGLRGLRRIWAVGGLPQIAKDGPILLLGVPTADLVAEAESNMRNALILIAIASLLAFTAALALFEIGIRKPLLRVVNRIESLRRGDLDSRIGAPYPSGEIGEVMRAFDRTATELQVQQAVIRQQARDQLQAQTVLQHSEMQLRAMFDNAAVGIVRISPEGRILQANQRLCDMLGLTPSELSSRSILDFTHAGDINATRHHLERLFAGDKEVPSLHRRCLRSDGTLLWTDNAATLVRDAQGNPDYFIVVVADINARKQAEEEAQTLRRELEERVASRTVELADANKRLESFSYSVSHDLRTPLRAISGFAQILARRHRETLNEEGQRYMDNIVRASALMGRLIEDLLNYSRLGRQTVTLKSVALDEVVADVMRQLQPRVAELGAEIHIADPLPLVRGDPTLLTQIILNLLDNALTYCKPGSPPRVELSCRTEPGSREVTISVTDHGIGIAAAQFEAIFGVFQRLHSQDEYPGTGIGLATVKQAAAMLGGQVWVESEPGVGSTFHVKLAAAD